jgi:hypothetical protein
MSSGLLNSMIAGGAKSVADGRIKQIEQKEEFDLKTALLDAQIDKEMRLKEAGFKMDDKRAQATMDKRKSYMTGDDGKELSAQEAASKAMKAGDFEAGEGLIKMVPKSSGYKSIELKDGSVFSFDESTGSGKVILKGVGEVDVPKNEIELAYKIAGGDAKKAADILVTQKAKVAAAGRAPERASDDDLTFADWKKKPENKGKGRDDYAKEKSLWGKADENVQTVTEEPVLDFQGNTRIGKNGEPMMTRKTTRKEKVPTKTEPKVRTYDPKTRTFK